ncbi:CwfJ C-terminus 1-domain-containing protein-like protein [Mycena floridula]|nr:CwfJ C-terminus 1-domain-containing protein-like protein [Mycena floridula]
MTDKRRHDSPDPPGKKRHRKDEDGKKKKKRKEKIQIIDDNPDDEDMWVEKNIDMDGELQLTADIPTAESLKLAGPSQSTAVDLPPSLHTESKLQRDDWMMEPGSSSTVDTVREAAPAGLDFFSNLGQESKKKARPELPDPEKPKVSSRELNPEISGRQAPEVEPTTTKITPGGPGSSWRMMRLRKVYEAAEEDGTPVEELALERFGSLELFEEAKAERRILDEREGETRGRSRRDESGEKRFMFTDIGGSGASSRSNSFRRPGESAPSTPTLANKRLDSLRLPSQAASPLQQSYTPIPSVMTPGGAKPRGLSPSSLNKLQAKALRARLMDLPDAEKLEREYQQAAGLANGARDNVVRTKVEVLPTLDGRGRMYDVGHGRADDGPSQPGNRKKKEEKFETRDPKTGDIVRYNADDDTTTLGEMLRQERFGAGMADQKDLDAQFAKAIMGDGKFQNDLDYIDDNAEKLGRQKMRSDAMKRQFAINDYKRTQQALSTCEFCYGEDGETLPKAPVVAMGTRAYLSCTTTEELLDGHCLIVPIQHHLNMLEGDDDVWDEVKNFMKCVMRMYAEEDKGVVFYETVISFKRQRHTCIECVPVPWEVFEILPGYFKESILASEAEWSQHKKLIDFSSRPGGFRRAMVPNLPYFMVQFDHKGEKGYGHVIEGTGGQADEDDDAGGDADKGTEFPRYFAAEIIGNVLEIEARKWRRPKRIDFRMNKERVAKFKKSYSKFDWTHLIEK